MDMGKTRGHFYFISPTRSETSSFRLSLKTRPVDFSQNSKINRLARPLIRYSRRTVLMPQHRMDESVGTKT